MKDRIRTRTKHLTVCAVLSALGVVLLGIGSLFGSLDLSAAALASLFCIIVVIEIGGGYPWALWASTSILAFLLPQKTPALFYALFLGYYPILKSYFERSPRILSWVWKLLSFHIAIGAVYLCLSLFLPEALAEYGQNWMLVGTYALALVCFILYDVAITMMITAYLRRFRRHFQRIFH